MKVCMYIYAVHEGMYVHICTFMHTHIYIYVYKHFYTHTHLQDQVLWTEQFEPKILDYFLLFDSFLDVIPPHVKRCEYQTATHCNTTRIAYCNKLQLRRE